MLRAAVVVPPFTTAPPPLRPEARSVCARRRAVHVQGAWMWLGFGFATASHAAWNGSDWAAVAVDCGYDLVGAIIQGALLVHLK
jgi:hypothetical protein